MAVVSRTVAAFLLLAATSGPALAEDPADMDWSGSYLGTALAVSGGENKWIQGTSDLELVPGSWSGALMVLSLGRTWQRGSLTYGTQLSYGLGSFSANPTSALFITCSIACETSASDLVTLRGRAGFAAGRMHYFASGGLARANVTATNQAGAVIVREDILSGWTAGLGFERIISDDASLSVTYDRVDLGTMDVPWVAAGQTDVNLDLFQVGMNYHW
jgi:outer membrane immunogenic protein